MRKYLIRLDDACPTMDGVKWRKIENILDKYNLCPLVGVIPFNQDVSLKKDAENNHFWEDVRLWENKGWSIAMHGYDHVYITNEPGINPIWNRSEFAGLPLDVQRGKIRRGINIFRANEIMPKYFFAPSHTFDDNTIEALKLETNIRIISDTIAFQPYKYEDVLFLPQQFGSFKNIRLGGYWTFCFHPNTMNVDAISQFDDFIKRNREYFIAFDEIDVSNVKKMRVQDKILRWCYFLRRRI